jgi:hypothetical protein
MHRLRRLNERVRVAMRIERRDIKAGAAQFE